MTNEQIKKLVDDSRDSVQQEFDDSVQSIKDKVSNLKKSTISKI